MGFTTSKVSTILAIYNIPCVNLDKLKSKKLNSINTKKTYEYFSAYTQLSNEWMFHARLIKVKIRSHFWLESFEAHETSLSERTENDRSAKMINSETRINHYVIAYDNIQLHDAEKKIKKILRRIKISKPFTSGSARLEDACSIETNLVKKSKELQATALKKRKAKKRAKTEK